jgi:hypothetical protein
MFTHEDREKWKALIDEGKAVSEALRSYSDLVTQIKVPGNGPADRLLIDIMQRVSEINRRSCERSWNGWSLPTTSAPFSPPPVPSPAAACGPQGPFRPNAC